MVTKVMQLDWIQKVTLYFPLMPIRILTNIILAGESGEFAYVSKWNDFDIMFHVAPLMPSQANDKQQVLRKKHIGNGKSALGD